MLMCLHTLLEHLKIPCGVVDMISWQFAGAVFALFLAALLLGKKHKTQADRILNFWMLVTGIQMGFYYLLRSGLLYEHPFHYFLGVQVPFPLFHAPLLYLYVAALTRPQQGKRPCGRHLLPVPLAYLMFYDFYTLPVAEKIAVFEQGGGDFAGRADLLSYGFIVSGLYYLCRAGWLLNRHKRGIGPVFSKGERANLIWLRCLIAGLGTIWLIVTFGEDDAIYSASTIYVLFIGYLGIRQVGVFAQSAPILTLQAGAEVESMPVPMVRAMHEKASRPEQTEDIPEQPSGTGMEQAAIPAALSKYKKSSLLDSDIQAIQQRLATVMRTQKPFVNPELGLADLAKVLDIHPNQLSQVINSAEGCNFYDYINQQRVQAFLEIVNHPRNQHLTLLAIAYDCGFNSKAAFNRNFKKSTGLTPSEYLRNGKKIELEA